MKHTKKITLWAVTLALSMGVFASAATAQAAVLGDLYLSPNGGSYQVGTQFTVAVRLNSGIGPVNAAQGEIQFDPQKLQVVGLSKAGSIFTLWAEEPDFSNQAGIISYAGGIPTPGFTGAGARVLNIIFRARTDTGGSTTGVAFLSGSILANDGRGTNVIGSLGRADFTLSNQGAVPTEANGTIPVPVVTSSTHPVSSVWYSNNDPVFTWSLPAGVDGVSYLIDPKSTANPGNQSDGQVATAQYNDVKEGASYFHIKFSRNGLWGPIRHFPFKVDTLPPDPFLLTRVDDTDSTEPQPKLTFVATDSGSGIARYVMRIGQGDWFPVEASGPAHPFVMPVRVPGSHAVVVEAFDAAGNATRATLAVTVNSITRPVITLYPRQVNSHASFAVGGTADPDVTVQVQAFRAFTPFRYIVNTAPDAVVQTHADAAGTWLVTIPPLNSGVYSIDANAIDQRGAVSTTSEPVSVRVGYRMLWWFLDALSMRTWWAILIWLILLILIVIIGRRVIRALGRALRAITSRRRRRVKAPTDNLMRMIQDINDELALLNRVAKHRPLYAEEKYLRSKLMQYRKHLKSVLSE